MQDSRDLLKALDAELATLIEKYHTTSAATPSDARGLSKGNRYQSLDLRGEILPGFRTLDADIYTGIPLRHRSVVDLGCNMGEMTRAAARAGAALADGIEYDPLLVRIGNLVNVYNDLFNVRLRQGDPRAPDLLTRRYDVGLSFSTFAQLHGRLSQILANVDSIFVLETHALEEGWLSLYTTPFAERFPFWCLYGFTDHGADPSGGRRALLLFSKTAEAINGAVFARAARLPPQNAVVTQLDLERSALPNSLFGRTPKTRALFCELRESIARIPVGDLDAVVRALAQAVDPLEAARNPDEPELFSSDGYWTALFSGARDYRATGQVGPDNPLLSFLRRMARRSEPGMRELLSDPDTAPLRVAERLAGFLQAINGRNPRDHLIAFNPIRADIEPAHIYKDMAQNFTLADGQTWHVHSFDGYHRVGACWLAKAPSCNVMFCWTNMTGLTTFNFAGLEGQGGDAVAQRMIESAVLRFIAR